MRPSTIRVELIKLNPYDEVTQAEFIATRKGQEFTAFHFTLDDDGEVIGIRDDREILIGSRTVGSGATGSQDIGASSYQHFFSGDEAWTTDPAIGSQ